MTLIIRTMPGGRFAIDDGSRLLDVCPCCDAPFRTERAAQATIDAISANKMTFDQALELAEIWQHKAKAPPPPLPSVPLKKGT